MENTCFGYIIIAFIVANSLTMGIQADWMVTHIGEDAPMVFDIFENMFAVVFTCELVMRIFVYNVNFFRMADWKWNIFDTLVVGLQLFDIITTLTIQAGSNNQAGANFNFMRLVRLMRLLRILRLMRVLRFVQELRSMVMSIAASLRSLMWTIVLLAFLMYGVGVCLTQMVADRGLEDPLIMQRTPEIKLFYGSLVEALVSLFAGITGGIDWNDLLEPLETEIGPWLAALFVLYIAFAVLAMMNVVTGRAIVCELLSNMVFQLTSWLPPRPIISNHGTHFKQSHLRPMWQASSSSPHCSPPEQTKRKKSGSNFKNSSGNSMRTMRALALSLCTSLTPEACRCWT